MGANRKRIAGFALKSRLPSMYGNREAVDAGGLMSYGADHADSYRRVAYYVDRILKGAKPADLPVEQPTKVEFAINPLQTAKMIGLTISAGGARPGDRVDQVIQFWIRLPIFRFSVVRAMSGHRIENAPLIEYQMFDPDCRRGEACRVTSTARLSG